MSFLDLIPLDVEHETGRHRFEAEAIKRFASRYDPQAFHLDEAAASASLLGGLCASGWHTAAVAMRCQVDHQMTWLKELARGGVAIPRFGPSPGVSNIRWPKPVMAGDTVTFFRRVTSKRLSQSRPGWAVFETATRGENQRGEDVFGYEGAGFVELG